jgi:hypothetical protein
MAQDLNDIFYSKLRKEKIEINQNRKPIKMNTFIPFLTVDVIPSRDHLGYDNKWTLYVNKELDLYISGGIINGCEYLDSIRYKMKLQNPYNNYVNPFYLFDILTPSGQKFFVDYYASEFDKLINDIANKISYFKIELDKLISNSVIIRQEIERLNTIGD